MMPRYNLIPFENLEPNQSLKIGAATTGTAKELIMKTLRRKPDFRLTFRKEGRNIIITREQ
jgi:hypothetical protein